MSGLESREYSRRDPSRWPRGTLYPQKLALTSPTSGGRSVGLRPRGLVLEFIHADLGISYVQDVIHQKCNNHHTRLETTKTRSSKNIY
jgi:hypothetical protein